MTFRVLLAALHLFSLGLGLGAVFARGRALARRDVEGVLYADNWWGLAAIVIWTTGPLRAFGGYEKGTAYYLASQPFQLKLAVVVLLMLLELWPMITFIRWRVAMGKGQSPDLSRIETLTWVNRVETGLVIAVPVLAAMAARGVTLW